MLTKLLLMKYFYCTFISKIYLFEKMLFFLIPLWNETKCQNLKIFHYVHFSSLYFFKHISCKNVDLQQQNGLKAQNQNSSYASHYVSIMAERCSLPKEEPGNRIFTKG